MESISHRELRNNSAEVLRKVAAGESFVITNNGRPVARIVPSVQSVLDELIESGQARPALESLDGLADVKPQKSSMTSKEILDDIRGPW